MIPGIFEDTYRYRQFGLITTFVTAPVHDMAIGYFHTLNRTLYRGLGKPNRQLVNVFPINIRNAGAQVDMPWLFTFGRITGSI